MHFSQNMLNVLKICKICILIIEHYRFISRAFRVSLKPYMYLYVFRGLFIQISDIDNIYVQQYFLTLIIASYFYFYKLLFSL
jgi:hypothetical protein